jgi:hypothetical protein
MGRDSYKIRLAFQGVKLCSSLATSDCSRPSRASGSSRPALWVRGRSRSPAGAVPLYRLCACQRYPGLALWSSVLRSSVSCRSGCFRSFGVSSGSDCFGSLDLQRAQSLRCQLFACQRFLELALRSAVSSRSDCFGSIGLSLLLLFSSSSAGGCPEGESPLHLTESGVSPGPLVAQL